MESEKLIKTWEKCQKIPGGNFCFSKLLGSLIPYTGSIPFKILNIQKGQAAVELKDCRKVRNHFNCIHAMALANLAELCSGIAMTTAVPSSHRCILIAFNIKYLKKARGSLTAQSFCEELSSKTSPSFNQEISVDVKNTKQEIVCQATAQWRISKK